MVESSPPAYVSLRSFDVDGQAITTRHGECFVFAEDSESDTIAVPPSLAIKDGRWDAQGVIRTTGQEVGMHRVRKEALAKEADPEWHRVARFTRRPTVEELKAALSSVGEAPTTDSEPRQRRRDKESPPKSTSSS
jgi:hypothetical protein